MSDIASATEGGDGDMSLDLRRVLRGFVRHLGGPEEFGKECAKIFKSDETTTASRVTMASAMARLIDNVGDGDDPGGLLTQDQIEAIDHLMEQAKEEEKDGDS